MRGATCSDFHDTLVLSPDEYQRVQCGKFRSARVGPVLTSSPPKLINKSAPVVRGWGALKDNRSRLDRGTRPNQDVCI
jgi:hypothetical protein